MSKFNIVSSNQFKRDMKRFLRSPKEKSAILKIVIILSRTHVTFDIAEPAGKSTTLAFEKAFVSAFSPNSNHKTSKYLQNHVDS